VRGVPYLEFLVTVDPPRGEQALCGKEKTATVNSSK
jgi:hypothetical protein